MKILKILESFNNVVYKNNVIDDKYKFSNLTLKFRNQVRKLLPIIKKLDLKKTTITTLGILFNVFALYNLFINEFWMFIMLLVTSYVVDTLNDINANSYTEFEKHYYRISEWIKFIAVSFCIYTRYFKKINLSILLLVLLLSQLNYLHYSIQKIIKNKENIWSKMFKNYSKDQLFELLNKTRNFDETMVIMYYILIIIYIHYSSC